MVFNPYRAIRCTSIVGPAVPESANQTLASSCAPLVNPYLCCVAQSYFRVLDSEI